MESAITRRRREELTFKANLRSTRYGWLRLTPAYSVHLVRDLVNGAAASPGEVLDPFCGTGTTALVCAEAGISATTTDINPFLVWLARAKCARYTQNCLAAFSSAATSIRRALLATGGSAEWVPPIHQIEKWWDADTLHALARAMAAIRDVGADFPTAAADLLRIAFCRVMIGAAHVSFGHQSMSFRARSNEPGLFALDPLTPLAAAWDEAIKDVARGAAAEVKSAPTVLHCDARKLMDHLNEQRFGLVVTSPPYPNRMSYIRELRPYMYWLGYLRDGKEAGELDWQAIGGTWGSATSRLNEWNVGGDLKSFPTISATCSRIASTSDLLARYVARYFVDMAGHCAHLYRAVRSGGAVHYIVGNSKFYDVLLPVEEFYAELFRHVGFTGVEIHRLRKRTSKRELFEYRVSGVKT
jgi:DNA modification methylase